LCYSTNWINEIIGYFDNYIDIGLTMIITDGPYPGYSCASEEHKFHESLDDSVFRQLYLQLQFYQIMQNMNIFIHTPDTYYYYGGNRNKYPYAEYTYTLPRWEDMTISRQLMYDTSYGYIVTSGWMFLPMIPYHNGSKASIWEPLSSHIQDYDFVFGMYFSYAVAPTIRGYELFDNNQTKAILTKWVSFYKKHREVLISDIIHIRRPDNQWIDGILHVNSYINECGIAIFFNPLTLSVYNAKMEFSLYYTGIQTNKIWISYEDSPYELVSLGDDYTIHLNITMKPKSITYYVFQCNNTGTSY